MTGQNLEENVHSPNTQNSSDKASVCIVHVQAQQKVISHLLIVVLLAFLLANSVQLNAL